MKQVQVTREKVAQWEEEAIVQLSSGWRISDVRRSLVRSGCSPDFAEQILRNAQKGARTEGRRAGRATLISGIVLLLAGFGLVIAQILVLPKGSVGLLVPVGLLVAGLVATVTGVLKSIFG